MGIQQSREDSEPILWLLRSISHPVFLEARSKLVDFSRKKCKLNVTKWELLLILQLNALDVKRVSQFLTGEQDPPSVDVNSLFFLLVLTNQELLFRDKVENIIRFIAFENEMPEPGVTGQPGSVTMDELLYIFQIAYQLLNRITDLDLINDPHIKAADGSGMAQKRGADQDQEGQYGCQAEMELVESLFGKPGPQQEDEADSANVIKRIQANADVHRFFQIFQYGKIADEDRLTLDHDRQSDKRALASTKSREYPAKGLPEAISEKPKLEQKSDEKLAGQGVATPTDQMRAAGGDNIEAKVDHTDEKQSLPVGLPVDQSNTGQDQGAKDLDHFRQAARVRVNPKHSATAPYSLNRLKATDESQETAHAEDCVFGNIHPQAKSPLSLIKISKRILEIRNEQRINSQIYDLNDNLEQLQNNIQHIISKNLHFYAQRQLLPFQRTLFAQRKAAETPPAAVNLKLRTLMIDVEAADGFQDGDAALAGVKKELRNTLEEYLQQSLVCLKYEHSVAKAKMMHYLGRSGGSLAAAGTRGTKRLLEQKKFKLLGQIQTIKSIFTSMMEQSWDLELLQGDQLYQNLYHHISCLYKSNIDQNFLLNFINLKNKKRESKRYINFLEGAHKQAMKITQNDLLNFDPEQVGIPQIYTDLAIMLEDKLHLQKSKSHIQIVKQHQHLKVQLIAYFTHLGKLKALNEIFKQKDAASAEKLKENMEARLKKLNLKLEKVDVELVNQLQKHQSRQAIYQQYYSSLGELSVIKCGVKDLDFQHIFDYLALAMIKQRTQEAIFFHVDHKPKDAQGEAEQFVLAKGSVTAPPVPPTMLSADDYASLIQLQQMKYIDGLLTPGIGDTQSEESFLNCEKYINVMENIRERCLKMSAAFEAATPLEVPEQVRAARFEKSQPEIVAETAKNCMKSLYENMGCLDQFEQVEDFLKNEPLSASTFFLDHSLDQKQPAGDFNSMLNEFDRLDHFIFEFVPFTELGEQRDQKKEQKIEAQATKDQALIADLHNLSSSYRYMHCDQIRNHTYKEQKIAYKLSEQHFERLISIEDNDLYEEQFKGHRDRTFASAIRVLFNINKRGFLNGFSLKYLSMPIEYSLLHNYWAYQVIKMYLVQQQKAKMLVDIQAIAQVNQLSLSQFIDHNIKKSKKPTQAAEGNHDATDKPSSLALKVQASGQQDSQAQRLSGNRFFDQLLTLLSNTETPDRRYKQSLFGASALYLEHQESVCHHQVAILKGVEAQARAPEANMKQLLANIKQRLAHFNDQHTLQGLYDAYERSYIEQNKIINQKAIDEILTGAGQYLGLLKEAIQKELPEAQPRVASSSQGPLLAQLEKLQRDAGNVQAGLSVKAKQLQDELAKQDDEQMAMPSDGQTSRRSRSPAGSWSSKEGPKQTSHNRTARQVDLTKELERKIIEQVIQALTYQDVLIAARHHQDCNEFANDIAQKLRTISEKSERVARMHRYCLTVSGVQDGQRIGLEAQDVAARHLSKGAKLMNAVLSGNMGNKIDVAKLTQQPDPRSSNGGTQERLDEAGAGPLSEQHPTGSNEDKYETTPQYREAGIRDSQQSSIKSLHSDIEGARSPATFSPMQEGLNYLVNFLNLICDQEDALSSARTLKQCALFQFGQMSQVEFYQMKSEHLQRCNEEHAAAHLLNANEIQQTAVQKYLESYERHAIFVKRELFSTTTKSDQNLLVSQFYEILSKKSQSLVKSVINKVDDVFCEAVLDDDEKTEFGNAQTKVRRNLDLEMRIFREFLDREANKRLTEVHESNQKQHEIKLLHSLTALKLLVHIYYLKQIQTHEDFMHHLQIEQPQPSAHLD